MQVSTKYAATICSYISASQGLITSKSRSGKRDLTIQRLELIAAQISAILSQNLKNARNNQNVRNVYAWLDSTAVLPWFCEFCWNGPEW